MKFTFNKLCLTVTCLLLFFCALPLFSESNLREEETNDSLENLVDYHLFNDLEAATYSDMTSQQKSSNYYSEKRAKKREESQKGYWKPTIAGENRIQPDPSLFFQTNIGIGFLYFTGVRGNLLPNPNIFSSDFVNAPLKRKLIYNRTPLYEYLLGYRIAKFLKVALAYTHQSNVTVQSKLENAFSPSSSNNVFQFSSDLALDAIYAKVFYEFPWPILMKNTMSNFYFSGGVGPGWQTWSNINSLGMIESSYFSAGLSLRQQIATKIFWMFDAGVRVQGARPTSCFSVVLGCKFNYWGRSGNIGKVSSQGSMPIGLKDPLIIKSLFQWSPYFGVQWNFPEFLYLHKREITKGKLTPMLTQFNVGAGFLYFKEVRGNLLVDPKSNTQSLDLWINAPIKKSLTYNRTPLFEYTLQHRFNHFVQLGVSYQNQGGVVIQTKPVTENSPRYTSDFSQFTANLNLNAILLKGYVSPVIVNIKKNYSISPFVGFGVGPGWQSWTRMNVNRTVNIVEGVGFGPYQVLNQKIIANLVINCDAGFRFSSSNPNYRFAVISGCKYNFWGQTRNLGLLSQQASNRLGLYQPVRIKSIYQWAPYLGVQWTFPNNYFFTKKYYLEGRAPDSWKPFFININSLQKNKSLFTQFSTGVGILYFAGLRGNLALDPFPSYRSISTSSPIKGRLSYSRTPLFEYSMGYRLCSWFKGSVSYQHQGNLAVETPFTGIGSSAGGLVVRSQLAADLILDALMAKMCFEMPRPFVWRNLVYSPYLALAGGPTWQTWKRIDVTGEFNTSNIVPDSSLYLSFTKPIRQKIIANMGFMFDMGLRIQTPYPNTGFSVILGLKFNLWGQARNIGKISQSLAPRSGLVQPLIVKSVYQWAPHLGVQWNF
ncbi:MAG: hypothetical protein S4CHLAM7_11110 [Chlamydiae bacterium]|nr:hypothetical protein [Chlamydiota bacterium]